MRRKCSSHNIPGWNHTAISCSSAVH
jgi:hypothetical protein